MAKIAAVEEAKHARDQLMADKSETSDSLGQKLAANIFKNLKVKLTNIHLRYEDRQTNAGHPFSAGVTLDSLQIFTPEAAGNGARPGSGGEDGGRRTRAFRKKVNLNSLAIYWQPREKNIFSEQSYSAEREEVRDIQFSSKISRQNSTCKGLNYLLGPIHMQAEMNWCPEPKKSDFRWRSCGST